MTATTSSQAASIIYPEQKHAHRLDLVSPGKPIPCCVAVPACYASKARYALRMLLVPLGLEPRWVDAAGDALFYGVDPPEGVRAALACAPGAAPFFADVQAFDADDAFWHRIGDDDVPVLFASADGRPDLVASTFLWLSGWQERADSRRDEHGRVTYAYSLTARLGTPRLPAVDLYRAALAETLRDAGVETHARRWAGRTWALCPTHDVDYLRKWRPGILYREFIQNLLLGRRREPLHRRFRRASDVVRQMASGDPYFRALHGMPLDVADRGGTATYFVKSGGGDPHDVTYRVGSSMLRSWMRRLLNGGFEIGLHPSYATLEQSDRLRDEKRRLEGVAGVPIASVRQHYLRYDPVRTGPLHASMDFTIDSTLGYAEHEGFRRGTCMPFQVYDVEGDRATDVWEMPLAVMESALFNRRGFDVEGAFEVTNELAEACRAHGGALVGLWHTTLGDEVDCRGWREHFLRVLDTARENEALIASLVTALRSWK